MNYLKIIFIYNVKDSPNKKARGERRFYIVYFSFFFLSYNRRTALFLVSRNAVCEKSVISFFLKTTFSLFLLLFFILLLRRLNFVNYRGVTFRKKLSWLMMKANIVFIKAYDVPLAHFNFIMSDFMPIMDTARRKL